LMTFPPDVRERPEASEVVKEFKGRNIEPEAYTLYAYAAVEVLEQAAKAAGSLKTEAIARALHSGTRFKTVLGEISYDSKGDVTEPDYALFVWKKGPDGKMEYNRLEGRSADIGEAGKSLK